MENKTIRFIGDIHGKLMDYVKVIEGVDNSIQVGDFGVGFGTRGEPIFIDNLISEMPGKHRFIRGNHDHPRKCPDSTHYIIDGTMKVIGQSKVMFVGGANSIDKDWRTPELDWWYDEECNDHQFEEFLNQYSVFKPDIMVTHECPERMFHEILKDKMKYDIPSKSRYWFEEMFKIHKPKVWIFGHYHISFDEEFNGTRFICLNELEHIDMEL